MHVGRRDVVGVEHAAHSCQPMQLVAVVMPPLGRAVTVGWGSVDVAPAHGAMLGSGWLAHLDGLRVDDEAVLTAVNLIGNPLADFLAQPRGELAAVVVLSPRYKVGYLVLASGKPVEQAVLAVDAQHLGRQAQCNYFKV